MNQFNVYTFAAAEDGWFVNSHYFPTPEGIFVFDSQLLIDYAEAVLTEVEQNLGTGQMVSVVVTTPHPEHYLASSVFRRKTGARFHSTKVIADIIEREGQRRLTELRGAYKNRLSHTAVVPTETFEGRREIGWKGLTLQLAEVKEAESASNLFCFIPEKKFLFAGDLIFNKVHPILAAGNIDNWRSVLGRLKGLAAKKVYPGHGPIMGGDIIPHVARYLDHFQLAVSQFGSGKKFLRAEDHVAILNVMRDKYPEYRLISNLEAGIEAEFARQQGVRAA